HQLSCEKEKSVIIVEGEWCADYLAKLGALSTTSGSAASIENTDLQPLAGRSIIIWPDNDEPGKLFAKTFSKKLQALNCKVCQIDIDSLNLPDKGDVVDWLAINSYATIEDILKLPTISVNNHYLNLPDDEISKDEFTEKSQTTALVDFTKNRVKLFHD